MFVYVCFVLCVHRDWFGGCMYVSFYVCIETGLVDSFEKLYIYV